MIAVITILEQNSIESNKIIYDGMTLNVLAESTYKEIIDISSSNKALDSLKPFPRKTKERIGMLMNSKQLNPATFFSFEFKLGVYLPLLAPFFIPLFLTLTLVIRGNLFNKYCKKKDEGKEAAGPKVKAD